MNNGKAKGALVVAGMVAGMVGGFFIGCMKEKLMNKCSCMDEF